jgi:hypothetical protein
MGAQSQKISAASRKAPQGMGDFAGGSGCWIGWGAAPQPVLRAQAQKPHKSFINKALTLFSLF